MKLETLGVVGLGAFGTFLIEQAEEKAPWLKIRGWDKEKASANTLEEALSCDAVIFAVPPKSYLETLREMVPRMREEAVIVDICTVKVRTIELLREIAGRRPFIGAHPMFGRQSFVDQGFSLCALQLVVCEHTLPPADYKLLETFLRQRLKLQVVSMTSDEHDEIQAREQLLTQRIGAVINRAGFTLNPRNIHTVSARHFFRAMKIVGNDESLFMQAAAMNPHWPKVLAQFELAEAEHKLDMLNGK